jgi:hypothetical protein
MSLDGMPLPIMPFRTYSCGTWYGLHSSNLAHYSTLLIPMFC